MSLDLALGLFAQANSSFELTGYWLAAVVLAAIVVPYLLGGVIAKGLRMVEYGWKIGVILAVLSLATVVVTLKFPPKLGVDLKGGVILIYQVDMDQTMAARAEGDTGAIDMNSMVQILSNRINPGGTKEIVVRTYGDRQIEIIIPDANDVEIDQIKKQISTAGNLVFRIVANRIDHKFIEDLAKDQAGDRVIDDAGDTVGRWVRVGRDAEGTKGKKKFKIDGVVNDIIRDAGHGGELINAAAFQSWVTTNNMADDPIAFEKWLFDQGIEEIQILMATNDGVDVTGKMLATVRTDFENFSPCVAFTMTRGGSTLFGNLTGNNLPTDNNQRYRRLGIVLDSTLLSAPRIISTISDSGRITGKFTNEEVSFLIGVLNA